VPRKFSSVRFRSAMASATAHEPVTTSSRRLRPYYDQGIAYLHSYVWIEAARSFNQALRLDRTWPWRYLGLSYALEELGVPEGAKRAGESALALDGGATGREQLRIELRARQLAASAKPGDSALRADISSPSTKALEKYPKDVELLLLRGHAHESAHQMPGMGGGEESLRFYQRALAESRTPSRRTTICPCLRKSGSYRSCPRARD